MEKKTILITGVLGLVGSATAIHFGKQGYNVVGVDNGFRKVFFGEDATQNLVGENALAKLPNFIFFEEDIRNQIGINKIFATYAKNLIAIVHCAAQPSHDWAAKDPIVDFTINANGTLIMLEATRKYAPDASFVFLSTNKVYGSKPNDFEYSEGPSRWTPLDVATESHGFNENLGLDATTHSVFGVSKTAADLMVQEYGRYFGLRTVCMRGGCLTGPLHAGAELHGFLSYLIKCAVNRRPYTIFGYGGKQVRDNIHTDDLVRAIHFFIDDPDIAQIYNIGGGVENTISVIEAIDLLSQIDPRYKLEFTIEGKNRIGDHIWYATDFRKFQNRYPLWAPRVGLTNLFEDMVRSEYDLGSHID